MAWTNRAWPTQVGGVVWTNGGVARTKCGLHKGGVVWTKGRGFGEWGRGHVVGVASDRHPPPQSRT